MADPDERQLRRRAENIIGRMFRYRPRSEREIRHRLQQHKIPEQIIADYIQRLTDMDMLNDRRFTREWIRARLRKPLGPRRIFAELKKMGVADTLIREEMHPEVFKEEEALAFALAKRRWASYKDIDHIKKQRRVYDYLTRRGFSPSIIQKIVRTL